MSENVLKLSYPKDDDRYEVDPFTVAVAAYIAETRGLDLDKLRNFGEEPVVGNNKSDFIRDAYSYTDPYLHTYPRLTPVEVAEIWKKVFLKKVALKKAEK